MYVEDCFLLSDTADVRIFLKARGGGGGGINTFYHINFLFRYSKEQFHAGFS